AAWITEDVLPVPKNIYGVTKLAAESLCELFHRIRGLSCLILGTSRFFPDPGDREETRENYPDDNVKINEFFYRRGVNWACRRRASSRHSESANDRVRPLHRERDHSLHTR